MVAPVFEAVTLDQLRALVAVADSGSFSAAARKLRRVQSAVSTAMANLESHLGVPLWDRTSRVPQLTARGQAVLAAARRVLDQTDDLRRLSADLAGGLEPTVSLCLDALFPLSALIDLCREFARQFPAVDLRIDIQLLSAVSARVLGGQATLGVVSPVGMAPGLQRQSLATIRMVPVVGRQHPLAQVRGPVPTRRLAEAIQIVLSERGDSGVADQAVLSDRTWRVADLHAKQALLRAGLGWGNLPAHLVRDDLADGALVALRPAAWTENEHLLALSAIWRADSHLGPAHQFVLERLQTLCARETADPPPLKRRRPRPRRR